MRRIVRIGRAFKSIVFLAVAVMLLASCSTAPGAVTRTSTQYSPYQIGKAVIMAQDEISDMQPLLPDDDYFAQYVSDIYQLDGIAIENGAIFYADGMIADEIAVLLLSNSSDVKGAKETLEVYKENRAAAFMGYAPIQTAILDNGIVLTHGNYVALLVCEDPQKAQSVFMACFSDELPQTSEEPTPSAPDDKPVGDSPDGDADTNPDDSPDIKDKTGKNDPDDADGDKDDTTPSDTDTDTGKDDPSDTDTGENDPPDTGATPSDTSPSPPPDKTVDVDDAYDPDSILYAWRTGDKSGLTYKNRSILDAATLIIDTYISKGMSDYEKELAIHDWLVHWGNYDAAARSNARSGTPDPDNANPYAMLFNKKGICLGFSTTFQLFMDMLDVESILVNGKTSRGGAHAWNVVRIDGEWYCVDTTWNAPSDKKRTDTVTHKYFNVTSDYMWDTGHRWDRDAIPEATSEKLYYKP